MTLHLTLTIQETRLRYQQDSVCELVLANRGNAPLAVADPRWDLTALRLKVLDVKSGAETLHVRRRPAGSFGPTRESPLKPGETLAAPFMLLGLPKTLLPGEYDVSAVLLYDKQARTAESPPVRVHVVATTPRNLFYHEGQGAWINTHADPAEVVLMTFVPAVGGGPRDLRFCAPAGLRAAPVLSGNGYRRPIRHAWTAWIDEAGLKTVHMHAIEGPSPLRSSPVAAPKDLIVPPLHSEPTPDDDSRPGGALLLLRESGELETIRLGLDRATSLARAPLPGPRPLWIQSFEREGNKRTILVVQAAGDKVRLSEAFWPGSPGTGRVLGEWPGAFMGAGAVTGDENALIGTLLLRQNAGARLAWDRIDFTLDAKGAFTATPAAGPVSDPADPFEFAPRVRVSERAVAALLKTSKGFWWLYDGKTAAPVPHDLRETPYPLDVEFMNARVPVLIAGFKEAGFHMRMGDGTPLPPGHGD